MKNRKSAAQGKKLAKDIQANFGKKATRANPKSIFSSSCFKQQKKLAIERAVAYISNVRSNSLRPFMFDTLDRGDDNAVATERYHLKLRDLLEQCAALFAKKGYHNTSIRDIAREMNTSLAGLYYYFKTKEELLFLISRYSFDTVMTSLAEKLDHETDSKEKLKILVQNHLQYFVTHLDAMKVLAHESDSLTGEYYILINDKKRQYLDILERLLLDIQREEHGQKNLKITQPVKIAALSLFGMMNWTYTWYNPDKREHSPANIAKISEQMVQIFLNGFVNI